MNMSGRYLLIVCFVLSGYAVQGQSVYDIILRSEALTEAGDYEAASDMLNDALAISADSRLYLERAHVRLLSGDYEGATGDYREVNRLVPSSGEYGLARVFSLRGNADSALYHLGRHMASPFKKMEKEIMMDRAFRSVESRPEWRQFWKREWYSVPETTIREIEYYLSSGKSDEAETALAGLKSKYGEDDDVLYAEALIYISSEKYREAVGILSGLMASDPDNERYLRTLAGAREQASDPAGASDVYSKLISLEVADARLFISRARCYGKTGERGRALDDVRRYLDLYPEDKEALSLAGNLERESDNNLEALKYFTKNLELHPDDPVCYIERADSYYMSGSWEWAIEDYSMSLDLDPGNADVWFNKGVALLNTGRTDDACFDFRRSLSLGNKRAAGYISKYCIK
jgi:tetratricopeptide (TPR) repeat protein